MRITQGCFSFLPDLDDVQITVQIEYILQKGWAVGIEYTDDPHPWNTDWNMWGHPMLDLNDAKVAMMEPDDCRKAHGDACIRIIAFDDTRGFKTVMMSFICSMKSSLSRWNISTDALHPYNPAPESAISSINSGIGGISSLPISFIIGRRW